MVISLRDNIAAIRERISAAAKRNGRDAKEIKLMGVSKFHPLEMMVDASQYVDLLGENRVQEASGKALGWPSDNKTPWHLIGHLQRNKARKALEIFSLIESIDTLDLARMLDRILDETSAGAYPSFIEVNMSGEISKEGVEPENAERLLTNIMRYCGHLRIDGLMTIGPLTDDRDAVRRSFAGLRELRDSLRTKTGLKLPELSMGMSGDFELGIEEGSTIVRVGTAIFGPRDYGKQQPGC